MEKREALTAFCWIVLGLVISVWSATFPFGRWEALGPAVLPFACGLMLILLGSLLLFQVRRKKKEKPFETPPLLPRGAGLTRVVLSVSGMLLAAVLFQFVGYTITVFCLILSLMRINEPEKWKSDLFYAFVFTLGSYMLFQVLLKASLPPGFLGF